MLSLKVWFVGLVFELTNSPASLKSLSLLKSIQIPYYCNEHKVVKIFVDSDLLEIKEKEVTAPDNKCPECDKKMVIDEDVELFLQFMAG